MPRREKSYHFIYKTTCNITNRYYYGMHSTFNLNDGYVGSGKRLWNSIRKYGAENHICEHIQFYNNRKELREREAQLINEQMLKDDLCMNINVGGLGGFSSEMQRKNAEKSNKKQQWLRENDPEWVQRSYENHSNGHKESYKLGRKKVLPDWTGKTHKEETKLKMQSKAKQRTPSQNSQYGTCWITNTLENKKIHRGDTIPEGWRLGRKINGVVSVSG